MPTYEFRCPDGTVIERIFKMSEVPDEIPLPDGGGVAVRMISGGAGLLFKGTGFYITDYGKDGKKDQRAASSSESGGGSDKAESKSDGKSSDAKPAASSESKSDSKSSDTKSPSGGTAAASKPAPKPD